MAQEVVEVLRPLVLVLEAGGLEVAFGHQVQRPGGGWSEGRELGLTLVSV